MLLVLGEINAQSQDIEELQQQANEGNLEAQFELGLLYFNGQGVEQDYTQAAHWYRQAAEQGHAEGQYNLGVHYDTGQGVEQDYRQAAHWYRQAAEQGHAEGQFRLGALYFLGQGVEQDYRQAYVWSIIAKASGGLTEERTEGLEEGITILRGILTPVQINQAQKRASQLYEVIQTRIANSDSAN